VGAVALLVVVHVYPDLNDDQRVRIVSARKASTRERKTMSNSELSPEQRARLEKLAQMDDGDIDFSDIPELTDEQLSRAFRPGLGRPIKQPVTIRLDTDIVNWFKQHAGDKPYQTEINRVLRQHVTQARKRRA
jgi:uncharacterized protein (DUF4415 family)